MNEHFGNRKNLYTPFAFKLAWSFLLDLAILIKPHCTYDRENDLQITYQRKDLLYYEKDKENGYCGTLLAAFTCIATMIIKIPTPTFGYIHLGDGLVLLCGIILGPELVHLPLVSAPCLLIFSPAI